jgi:hypothetical protein
MRIVFGWLLLLALAGCAGPSTRPFDAPTKADCESSGRVWHADRSHCGGDD